jgi:hypothetical protein
MPFNKLPANLRRILLTIGLLLLLAVALALLVKTWRESINALDEPEQGQPVPVPFNPFGMFESIVSAFPLVLLVFPIIAALVAIPVIASSLFQKLYAIESLHEAHSALNYLVFGLITRRPFIIISEGRVAAGEDSLAGRMGGPCTLIVYDDTAVVTEQYGRLKRILGAGIHTAERYEKVWETIDLRPQRWVYEVFALTREGIPISCEADLSFCIEDQPLEPEGKRVEGPYPFAEDAVLLAATSKWVRESWRQEHHRTWVGRVVASFAEGLLRDILAEYRLDWLLAPSQRGQMHPRKEIRQRFEQGLQERVWKVGAKLLDVKIGAIEVKARDASTSDLLSEIVSKQWIEAWHATWKTQALASRAEGEAELLRLDTTARMQAQAEMVVTLTEALQSIVMDNRTARPYVLALRFVEAMRWMSYNPANREFMPPEAMRTLRRMQKLLGAGSTEPDDQEISDNFKE